MRLSEYLDYYGIRREFFAKRIGVCRLTIDKYVRGITRPKLEIIFKIQEVTEGKVTPYDWLADHFPNQSQQQEKKTH